MSLRIKGRSPQFTRKICLRHRWVAGLGRDARHIVDGLLRHDVEVIAVGDAPWLRSTVTPRLLPSISQLLLPFDPPLTR